MWSSFLATYKRDLEEFVSTVRSDTEQVIGFLVEGRTFKLCVRVIQRRTCNPDTFVRVWLCMQPQRQQICRQQGPLSLM